MNGNNGTPKYVIKSCLSPYRKFPASEKANRRKVRIPDSSIYANRKTTDLKLTFSHCNHIASEEPTMTAMEAESIVHDVKECAADVIQRYMKSYFSRHPNFDNSKQSKQTEKFPVIEIY